MKILNFPVNFNGTVLEFPSGKQVNKPVKHNTNVFQVDTFEKAESFNPDNYDTIEKQMQWFDISLSKISSQKGPKLQDYMFELDEKMELFIENKSFDRALLNALKKDASSKEINQYLNKKEEVFRRLEFAGCQPFDYEKESHDGIREEIKTPEGRAYLIEGLELELESSDNLLVVNNNDVQGNTFPEFCKSIEPQLLEIYERIKKSLTPNE